MCATALGALLEARHPQLTDGLQGRGGVSGMSKHLSGVRIVKDAEGLPIASFRAVLIQPFVLLLPRAIGAWPPAAA